MQSIENVRFSISIRVLIAIIVATVSITSSILYGVNRLDNRMQTMQAEFRLSTDSIKHKQDMRAQATDNNFADVRKDIQAVNDKISK